MSHNVYDHSDHNGNRSEGHVDLMAVMFLIDLRQNQHDDKAQNCSNSSLNSCDKFIAKQIISEYNDVFSRAAALSPAFTFMPQQIKEYVENWSAGSGILYMDAGVLEPPALFSADLYSDITALLMKKGILLTSRLVPNGIHAEKCWRKQLPLVMNTLLYDLEYTGIAHRIMNGNGHLIIIMI